MSVSVFSRNKLIEREEDTEWVCSLVDEMCLKAWDMIYGNYIKRQVLPFTVLQARECILDIVKVRLVALIQKTYSLNCRSFDYFKNKIYR